jgi:hypothetical protein
MRRRWHGQTAVEPAASTQLTLTDSIDIVKKRTLIGKKEYDRPPSELLWDLFQEGITEMMQTRYQALRLQAIFDELESQCPIGYRFNNEQHLLNKFRSVADGLLRLMHRSEGASLRRGDQPAVLSPIYTRS